MQTLTSTEDDGTPAALWRTLRYFIVSMFTLFGAPEVIARLHTLTREQHKDILAWLRPLEALLRKLIYLDAVELDLPRPTPRTPRAPRQRPRRLVEHDPDKPEDWRVSFKVCAPTARATATRSRNPSRFVSAWPIAERFEALLRGFNEPAPLVRRLARLLRKRPERAASITAPWTRPLETPASETLSDATRLCVQRRYPNTS